jgi:hypothetical protein
MSVQLDDIVSAALPNLPQLVAELPALGDELRGITGIVRRTEQSRQVLDRRLEEWRGVAPVALHTPREGPRGPSSVPGG